MHYPDELWVVLGGLALAAVRLVMMARRHPWRGVGELAARRGLVVRRSDSEDLPVRYAHLELMSHGYNRRVSEIAATEGSPLTRVFCYHYEVGFGKAHDSREWTVAVVETNTRRPGVWIGHGRDIEPLGLRWRYRPVTLPTGFGALPWKVYAESPGWLEPRLDTRVWSLLRSDGDEMNCELRGGAVALYREGIMSPESQIDLLARAMALAEIMDRVP